MTAEAERSTKRPLGRPRNDGPHPPLTREIIADTALDIVAERGFPTLTMRVLAAELNVTVRALYRHVADRKELINLIAARIIELQPEHTFSTDDWRDGVRRLYRETRRLYRRIGLAVLFAFEESIDIEDVPPGHNTLPADLIASLRALGLSQDQAVIWRQQFLTDVFGFSLLIDHLNDHATEEQRAQLLHTSAEETMPGAGGTLPRADGTLPGSTGGEAPGGAAAGGTTPGALDTDRLFEHTIDRAILTIEAALKH